MTRSASVHHLTGRDRRLPLAPDTLRKQTPRSETAVFEKAHPASAPSSVVRAVIGRRSEPAVVGCGSHTAGSSDASESSPLRAICGGGSHPQGVPIVMIV